MNTNKLETSNRKLSRRLNYHEFVQLTVLFILLFFNCEGNSSQFSGILSISFLTDGILSHWKILDC